MGENIQSDLAVYEICERSIQWECNGNVMEEKFEPTTSKECKLWRGNSGRHRSQWTPGFTMLRGRLETDVQIVWSNGTVWERVRACRVVYQYNTT